MPLAEKNQYIASPLLAISASSWPHLDLLRFTFAPVRQSLASFPFFSSTLELLRIASSRLVSTLSLLTSPLRSLSTFYLQPLIHNFLGRPSPFLHHPVGSPCSPLAFRLTSCLHLQTSLRSGVVIEKCSSSSISHCMIKFMWITKLGNSVGESPRDLYKHNAIKKLEDSPIFGNGWFQKRISPEPLRTVGIEYGVDVLVCFALLWPFQLQKPFFHLLHL